MNYLVCSFLFFLKSIAMCLGQYIRLIKLYCILCGTGASSTCSATDLLFYGVSLSTCPPPPSAQCSCIRSRSRGSFSCIGRLDAGTALGGDQPYLNILKFQWSDPRAAPSPRIGRCSNIREGRFKKEGHHSFRCCFHGKTKRNSTAPLGKQATKWAVAA